MFVAVTTSLSHQPPYWRCWNRSDAPRREARHRGEGQRAGGQPATIMEYGCRATEGGVTVASKADRFVAMAMTNRCKMEKTTR